MILYSTIKYIDGGALAAAASLNKIEREIFMKRTKYIAVVMLLMLSVFAVSASASAAEERDSIAVTGTASVETEPDMASVTLSMTEYGKSAASTRAALAERIERLSKYIASIRVDSKDFKTTGYELAPNYVTEREKRVQKGYAATVSFAVTVRNLADLGAVIDGSAEKCSASVNNVSFGLQKREEIERGLLKSAVEDARARASLVASTGGRSLGRLVNANIGTAGAAPLARKNTVIGYSMMADAAMPATQLAAGVINVSVSVSLVFELK